ncbi:hypothetical protein M0638_10530 [Roseomonas sp. NAR14]|uniref:ApeI dehydratase-like domain-containing protein n=1 Tax=Roseomonas acroporae TaxID=2937791 RepID=A0A9X1Y753_9PROT|nr:hypothetical protein [Roseomonas acroporae]MCK8784818.1 hypothetical protein [Roseomonas acroporae]
MPGKGGTRRAQFTVPASHPSLPGHFPGHPVVPGVVLLDAVLAALTAPGALPGDLPGDLPGAVPEAGPAPSLPSGPVRLHRAKFLAPVGPGETVTLELRVGAPRIAFTALCRGTVVLTGELEAADPAPAWGGA